MEDVWHFVGEGVRPVGEGDWKREVMMEHFARLSVWLLSWKKTDRDSTCNMLHDMAASCPYPRRPPACW
jgi:hypothetical protein